MIHTHFDRDRMNESISFCSNMIKHGVSVGSEEIIETWERRRQFIWDAEDVLDAESAAFYKEYGCGMLSIPELVECHLLDVRIYCSIVPYGDNDRILTSVGMRRSVLRDKIAKKLMMSYGGFRECREDMPYCVNLEWFYDGHRKSILVDIINSYNTAFDAAKKFIPEIWKTYPDMEKRDREMVYEKIRQEYP